MRRRGYSLVAGAAFDERISGKVGGSVNTRAEEMVVVVEGVGKGQRRRHRTLLPPTGPVCCHLTAGLMRLQGYSWSEG